MMGWILEFGRGTLLGFSHVHLSFPFWYDCILFPLNFDSKTLFGRGGIPSKVQFLVWLVFKRKVNTCDLI